MQPTWTFVRNGEPLILRRMEDGAGASLHIIRGDGIRVVEFPDVSALVIFQADMEALLVRTGWSLESFEPERRQDQERRTFPREQPDRRRWWTDGRRPSRDQPRVPTRRDGSR